MGYSIGAPQAYGLAAAWWILTAALSLTSPHAQHTLTARRGGGAFGLSAVPGFGTRETLTKKSAAVVLV